MSTKFKDEAIKVPLNSFHLQHLFQALLGPDHLIRELQLTATIDPLLKQPGSDPLGDLIGEYNTYVRAHANIDYGWVVLPTIAGLSTVFDNGLRFFGSREGGITNPPIFGRRDAAKLHAAEMAWTMKGRTVLVRVNLTDLDYGENGDHVTLPVEYTGLLPSHFETDDIEIINPKEKTYG